MRIVIPIEFYRKGGVERVIISLIPNLLEFTEKIIILLPRKDIEYFQSLIPASEKLIYEDFTFYKNSFEPKVFYLYRLIAALYKKLKLSQIHQRFSDTIARHRIEARINQVIRHHNADHCLYAIINRIIPPKVNVTLSGIAYDLFWQFAPLTYTEDFRETYKEPLKQWLDQADLIFSISQKTKDDILTVFPNATYEKKIKAVPLAGFADRAIAKDDFEKTEVVTFYYPSSFGIYKDHLTLLKAGIKLAQKGLKFKIVLIGKETDSLVNGELKLSQQSATKEYPAYLEACYQTYQENKEIISQYIEGLGYQDYETLEFYYQTCSCVVFPSKYEGFGLAIAEAIVQGIPVIASDLEVFKEQVDLYQCSDRVSFYRAGDVDALADRLEQFILNPLPRLLPEAIAATTNLWTWKDVAKQYIKLLQDSAR